MKVPQSNYDFLSRSMQRESLLRGGSTWLTLQTGSSKWPGAPSTTPWQASTGPRSTPPHSASTSPTSGGYRSKRERGKWPHSPVGTGCDKLPRKHNFLSRIALSIQIQSSPSPSFYQPMTCLALTYTPHTFFTPIFRCQCSIFSNYCQIIIGCI